ncbi:MAG: inositol monophosphatase family protein [Alphaproteobacteria bacterium]
MPTPTPRRTPLINVMVKAAFKAAKSLVHDFGEVEQLQVSRKGPGDFVSQADLKAEKLIRQELKRARPEFGFMLEEGGEIPGDGEHVWVVDPLDGTNNFLHGLPHFSISIGLRKGDDIQAGVVYDPLRDELFWAERAIGAYVADSRGLDRRLRIAGRRQLTDAMLATGLSPRCANDPAKRDRFMAEFAAMTAAAGNVRRWGSAALDLCYVAAGRFDGFWEDELSLWDIAAGLIIVREAGGTVSDITGGASPITGTGMIAANPAVHTSMLKALRAVRNAA